MQWTFAHEAELGLLIVRTAGIADEASTLEMIQALREAMQRHQVTRCLIDHRAISAVQGGTLAVYGRPAQVRQQHRPPRGLKLVEVVRPEHEEHFRFLETVFHNRGIDFTVLHDYDAALQILTQ
ncbi:MAG: hypothetical protein JNK29_01420 [Anaerolineales bacterium]|nr:hypothetical protein [Anaerolineales bacterium]